MFNDFFNQMQDQAKPVSPKKPAGLKNHTDAKLSVKRSPLPKGYADDEEEEYDDELDFGDDDNEESKGNIDYDDLYRKSLQLHSRRDDKLQEA
jgi:hypothetical protein